jgi:hypothetical protein
MTMVANGRVPEREVVERVTSRGAGLSTARAKEREPS